MNYHGVMTDITVLMNGELQVIIICSEGTT